MRRGRAFQLVLVGAGHAHLHLIRNAGRLRAAGIRPILVAPSAFHYSGLATGVLSGALPVGDNWIDIERLASACDVEHVPVTAEAIDHAQGRVRLASGAELSFDAVSLNVGSVVRDAPQLANQSGVWKAKPLSELVDLRAHLERHSGAGHACASIVVAGGGQSGAEVAAALAGLCQRIYGQHDVTLVSPDVSMSWAPEGAARSLVAAFQARGIALIAGRVTGRGDGVCKLDTGAELKCEALVLAIGLDVPPPASTLAVPHDSRGRIRVTTRLNVAGSPSVFAVGDCATIDEHPRPSLGVFGVRAAPVLLQNVCAMARGEALAEYLPQTRWLSILDLGDSTGLAIRGKCWSRGRGALMLKRWLDKSFIEKVRSTYRG